MKTNTSNQTWLKEMQRILEHGYTVQVRGLECKEICGSSVVYDMKWPIITVISRRMNYQFMAAEAFWILSGDARVSTISPYCKAIAQFSDNGRVFQGAYGPKVMEQMRYVVDTLGQDPMSRQAVISIWRESPRPSKDIPCTLSLQFLLRKAPYADNQLTLYTVATMRSSDVWLGMVYDLFNFSMISYYVVLMLKQKLGFTIAPGRLLFNIGSFHLYQTDFEKAANCIVTPSSRDYSPIELPRHITPDDLMDALGTSMNAVDNTLFNLA